jgi:hypothetical protein
MAAIDIVGAVCGGISLSRCIFVVVFFVDRRTIPSWPRLLSFWLDRFCALLSGLPCLFDHRFSMFIMFLYDYRADL